MAKPRLFFTGSTRIIGDNTVSALDLRVYAAVSLCDGMSLLKGKGAGCYASNVTLAAMVGCEYSSLSKALTRLHVGGYITMERRTDDKRCTVYRVTFPEPDSWPNRQPISGAVGDGAAEIVGRPPHEAGEIVGRASSENGGKLRETAAHYIPLKGELDSVETEEIDSAKAARLSSRAGTVPLSDAVGGDAKGDDRPSWARVSKAQGLGEEVREPSVGEHLAKFERALKQGAEGYDLDKWVRWLEDIGESHHGLPEGGWAQRLCEQAIDLMPEDQFRVWQAGATNTVLPVEAMVGEPGAVREQVAAYYAGINKAGREDLARRVGITPAELRAFTEGRQPLAIGKQMALRAQARMAA